MLNQLIKIVKENAGDAIVNNPAIPNERNNEAIQTAAQALLKNLQGQAAGGNLNAVLDIFKGGGAASSSPLVNNISSGVAGELMKKFGLDNAAAKSIVNQLIPVVMDKLKNKTNDPNDKSIDLNGIIGALSGKKSGGLLGTLSGLLFKRK
ncbi:MAG: DUF937 domain-containing protein [Lentimicrobium sp.]|nr:DUF937 domain-containing protein [Lentimicrobium sp.]